MASDNAAWASILWAVCAANSTAALAAGVVCSKRAATWTVSILKDSFHERILCCFLRLDHPGPDIASREASLSLPPEGPKNILPRSETKVSSDLLAVICMWLSRSTQTLCHLGVLSTNSLSPNGCRVDAPWAVHTVICRSNIFPISFFLCWMPHNRLRNCRKAGNSLCGSSGIQCFLTSKSNASHASNPMPAACARHEEAFSLPPLFLQQTTAAGRPLSVIHRSPNLC